MVMCKHSKCYLAVGAMPTCVRGGYAMKARPFGFWMWTPLYGCGRCCGCTAGCRFAHTQQRFSLHRVSGFRDGSA